MQPSRLRASCRARRSAAANAEARHSNKATGRSAYRATASWYSVAPPCTTRARHCK